jgi:hypothetical protein
MEMMQIVLGSLMNLMVLAIVIAGVGKLFQIHTELGEIRKLLRDRQLFGPATEPSPAAAGYEPPSYDKVIAEMTVLDPPR